MCNLFCRPGNTFRAVSIAPYVFELGYNSFENAEEIKHCFKFEEGTQAEKDIIPILPQFEDSLFIARENVIYLKEDGTDHLILTKARLIDELYDEFTWSYQESHELSYPDGCFDPTDFFCISDKDLKMRPMQTYSFYIEDHTDKEQVINRIESFIKDLKNQGMINFS